MKRNLDAKAVVMIILCYFSFTTETGAQSLYVTSGGTVVTQNTAISIAADTIVNTGSTVRYFYPGRPYPDNVSM
jgi:hypothetical protein